MTDWIDQYTAALDVRDAREQAHKPYIDAYTRLADRTAATTTWSTGPPNPTKPSPTPPPPPPPSTGKKPTSSPTPTPTPNPSDDLSTLRDDLANTQKARAVLATQTKDLTAQLSTTRAEAQRNAAQVAQLSRAKLEGERKLRDRDEELRGQRTLVEHAQDEMVALGLQLHMAEQKAEALAKENQELVERWMKRMGEEAERMNRDSRWE